MRFDTSSTRILALALAIGAAACAKGDDAATTDEVAGGTVDSATAANSNATAFRVSDVEIGKSINEDKTIKDGTDDFGVRDTIYAAVKTSGTAANATLVARWTYQDNQVVEEQTQTLNATGDMITSFRLTKATAWPKGTYKLSVLLNGAEVETEDFEIK
jgi:hypothetical protein